MSKKMSIRDLREEEVMWPGNPACQGCGGSIAGRLIFKALGRNSARVEVASCAPGFMNIRVPSFFGPAFEGAAAFMTGLARGYKIIGREDIVVAGLIGDGGTVDIGFQGLSGAAERNENVFWFTYDNEAYMNTGGQRSSATPEFASTSTTPVAKMSRGKTSEKKNVPMILALHHVPYVATASVAYPEDLTAKIVYGKELHGFRYIHINSPCPTGWGTDPKDTIKIARLAVESGLWPLYEILDGRHFKLTYKPRELKPVSETLKIQGRFRHLKDEEIASIQKATTESWSRLLAIDGKDIF
ncbi:MAG: thiamine pyrophosphate-dependent enzyme [Candidatus Bathyarchaeota archaeon]|jgi:pyruvate/2-oxoacid:ferredoxin oxidoreductase beta subunit|nr:thiamine pyrophosphate-dependent enzyme [Candidatus Bathyarchaeota archaeon]